MSMQVLKQKSEIEDARSVLHERGLSLTDTRMKSFLRRFGLLGGMPIGDELKSWDVLKTVEFIEQQLPKDAPVLDIGAYASEILPILHKAGYTNLTGIDLNTDLNKMPFGNSIKYNMANFMATPYPDGSFSAITSISVIEHGFDQPRLLAEMSRLLKAGGYLIASFDYWPQKIDTTGMKFFGMDWILFSKEDISQFIDAAANYGLAPVGELLYDAEDKVIDCAGQNYTFGWLALKKIGG